MKENSVPDLFIEKLLLDELPQHMKEQLLRDPAVRRRLEELKTENRRILEDYPPEVMAQEISRRLGARMQPRSASGRRKRPRISPRAPVEPRPKDRPRRGRLHLAWPALVPAAGFAILVLAGGVLLLTRGPSFFAPQDLAGEVRLKGGEAHLNVYVRTDAGSRILREGDRVSEGDSLQVGYVAGINRYGAIVSIDGRGTVTLHFPASAAEAQKLEGEGEILLPFSYTLDDAPGFERFFFVFSKEPFSMRGVLDAAEELSGRPQAAKSGSLRLPGGLENSSILLLK
jgi:hypothetical protein